MTLDFEEIAAKGEDEQLKTVLNLETNNKLRLANLTNRPDFYNYLTTPTQEQRTTPGKFLSEDTRKEWDSINHEAAEIRELKAYLYLKSPVDGKVRKAMEPFINQLISEAFGNPEEDKNNTIYLPTESEKTRRFHNLLYLASSGGKPSSNEDRLQYQFNAKSNNDKKCAVTEMEKMKYLQTFGMVKNIQDHTENTILTYLGQAVLTRMNEGYTPPKAARKYKIPADCSAPGTIDNE